VGNRRDATGKDQRLVCLMATRVGRCRGAHRHKGRTSISHREGPGESVELRVVSKL